MVNYFKKTKKWLRFFMSSFPQKNEFGYCAENVQLGYPMIIDTIANVFLYENTKVRDNVRIINSPNERVIIKKYSAIASNVTIVTANHISTVGIPHIILGSSHINDKSKDVVIDEDVWVGTGATLLAGVHLGRGSIIGAGSIVSKDVPPYALVVGSPAKIVKMKFTIDEILEHETALYPPQERFSRTDLQIIFDKYGNNKGTYGIHSILSKEDIDRISHVKKRIGFVEWGG